MKISTNDFMVIISGFVYGMYALFIDNNHRYSNQIAGILSFIISIWISISCARSLKN
ncbi:hypothetical protein [Bacillus sp. EB600]|uniref:hypothetical protein n=1 Tax=Bacillus sp. EB600 TaxID=2806345 RepID=UPI00210BF685|nr:hypothetical protein [Bacillus sp. EB600]